MKVLPTARILLVDSLPERREALRDALAVFGVGSIKEAAAVAELAASEQLAAVDVIVVHADDPEQVPENPFRDGAGAPAILIAEAPASSLVRAAARGGYEAALGAPLAPRLLYRRIGSVLQRARRVVRNAPAVAAPPVSIEPMPAHVALASVS